MDSRIGQDDDDGTVRQWSRGALELLGRSADEVCGLHVSELFTESTRTDCVPSMWPSPSRTPSCATLAGTR